MAIHNGYTADELDVGMTASFEKVISDTDIISFAEASGDSNPLHLDDEFAAGTMFKQRIAHGMLTASLISATIATRLPGTGTVYLSQSLRFRAPVLPGQSVKATVEVTDVNANRGRVRLACTCVVADKVVLDGEAEVMVPRTRQAA